ncbi:dTDP-4-dehydrorhamnose reductase [Brevundimonas sp. FT23042]|uniref:dTDP-4-dehydrorhamnose reductase n=1 Tax=Brevundimonas sp. FT23042 TaxID=3393749 RepID=UPI003B58AC75
MTGDTIHLLLTGAGGQVGQALQATSFPPNIVIHAFDRAALDITDADAVSAALETAPFAAIINAAAYTAVDRAENEVSAAFRVNALAPATLGEAAARKGLPAIHLSTDYVFDGASAHPYREEDKSNPIGVYGHSKRAGEAALLSANPRSVVIRTSWIVSAYGTNFVKTMLRLAVDRSVVRVVSDQHGAPTSAVDLARGIVEVAQRLVADPLAPTGIYHLTNSGDTTWAGLAEEIFRYSGETGGSVAQVEPIPTSEYPTPARRPMNSRLANDRIHSDFGIRLRPWQAAVRDIIKDLNEGKAG